MKQLLFLSLVLLLSFPFISAYEPDIDSMTNSKITLSFSALQTLDVKFSDITATAETASTSDTYIVDIKLSSTPDKVLLSVDISPLKEDYPDMASVLISGYIESDGLKEKFSKRISLRPESTTIKSLAPGMSTSTLIYWTTGLATLFVILLITFLFAKKPKKIISKKVKAKKKQNKRVKKKVKKKKRV